MKASLAGRIGFVFVFLSISACKLFALDGRINIHDPSTVIQCDGVYYVYGTGDGMPFLASPDGFTWQRGGRVFDRIPDSVHSLVPKNNGRQVWAPDVAKINGRYCLYYAVSTWGSPVSAIGLLTSPTLNPKSPQYHWTDQGPVVHSLDGQNLNSIDPGVITAPDGTYWLCYGSYIGNIQVLQLDAKTGGRIAPGSRVWIVADHSEASDIIYHDGYFYLFVNHGSCCVGARSTYNIRVGRSAKVTGPYLDRHGSDLADGAGTLFLGSSDRHIGPGHFGRIFDDGVEKFSCHYEADLDRPGRSVLDIRPLLWTADGWPLPGQYLKAGTYQLVSQQTGTILQANRAQTAANMGDYLDHDNQQWTITPAEGWYYTVINAESKKALQGNADQSITLENPAHGDSQLWKIDQLSDGSYRLEAKSSRRILTVAHGGVVLSDFTGADAQRWNVTSP
jgi:arabinan endo-1,5-alpha-L-arabinosidase